MGHEHGIVLQDGERKVNKLALLGVLLLAGCASPGPATIKGECQLFRDPGRKVAGVAREDRQWIAETVEAGIAGCGWKRSHG